MKLGLLVVLAVAVLVPSLSEGRIVSRCELKDKLGEAILLPKRLQKLKERILAVVICEVERRSRLNTGLVKVLGKRKTTTVRPTTTTLSTAPANETNTKPMATKPTVPELTQATSPSLAGTTNGTASGGSRRKREADTISNEPDTIDEEAETTGEDIDANVDEDEAVGEEGESIGDESDTTGDEPDTNGDESDTTDDGSDLTEMDRSLEEELNEEENKFDEEEMEQDDNRMGDEDEESDEQELEEGGKRKKRFVPRWKPKRKWKPWSLGYYGLFQLSDSFFCDSGYRWTRNVCKTSCTDFTDDNIMDDINCLVKSHYWVKLLRTTRRCYRTRNFFNECN